MTLVQKNQSQGPEVAHLSRCAQNYLWFVCSLIQHTSVTPAMCQRSIMTVHQVDGRIGWKLESSKPGMDIAGE